MGPLSSLSTRTQHSALAHTVFFCSPISTPARTSGVVPRHGAMVPQVALGAVERDRLQVARRGHGGERRAGHVGPGRVVGRLLDLAGQRRAVPPTVPITWMAKHRPSASSRSMARAVVGVVDRRPGYTLAPSRAWFLRSLSAVDMEISWWWLGGLVVG